MSENNLADHHDDCEDCRRQKKENQKYIAVYERMQSLRKNVEKTATFLSKHRQDMNEVRSLSKSLDFGIKKAIKSQGDAQNKTIEMIGYDIAADMIEKSARNKIQQDNTYLRRRIEAIRRDEEHQDEQHKCSLPKISQSRNSYNQNAMLKTSNLNQNKQLHHIEVNSPTEIVDNDCDSCSTKFSFFKNTKAKLNSSLYREKYRNMNLWLYSHQNQDESFSRVTNTISIKNRKIKPKQI